MPQEVTGHENDGSSTAGPKGLFPPLYQFRCTQTHTHTYIYVYMYVYKSKALSLPLPGRKQVVPGRALLFLMWIHHLGRTYPQRSQYLCVCVCVRVRMCM